MQEFLNFDEVYERICPQHLRLEDSASGEISQELAEHCEGLGALIDDIVEDICQKFQEPERTQQLQSFNENLLCVATELLKSRSLFLSAVAVNLASIVACDGGNTEDAAAVFDAFIALADEALAALALQEEEGADVSSIRPEILFTTAGVIFDAAARVPLSIENAGIFHRRATERLAGLADYGLSQYQTVLVKHFHIYNEPDNFPAGQAIILASYDAVVSDVEKLAAEYQRQPLPLCGLASSSLSLAAAMIANFHDAPAIHRLAAETFRHSWDILRATEYPIALSTLKKIGRDYSATSADKDVMVGLSKLSSLLEDVDKEPLEPAWDHSPSPLFGNDARNRAIEKFLTQTPSKDARLH